MLAKPLGAILVVDDLATSGYHMQEALKALGSLGIPAAGIAWLSAGIVQRSEDRTGEMDDEAKKRRLANLRPFQPGKSGNPGGRSKAQIDVRNAARAYTKEAIDTLVLVMRNGKPSEAAMAAIALLDRAWGKPAQQISGEFNINRDVRELSTAELLAIVATHEATGPDEPVPSGP